MEIRRLKAEEFYELRDLLDMVFTNKYNKETRFVKLFPRLFETPNEYVTSSHFGAFADGKLIGTAAMYPIEYVIGTEHIRLIANGNVAVHAMYRGKGVMSALLNRINAECDKTADLCYLHGDPVRYGRFGYVGAGIQYLATFQPEEGLAYTFKPMLETEAAFCKKLSEAKSDYIVREEKDFIPALRAGGREAVSVYDKSGALAGYLSLNRENGFVEEFALNGAETEVFFALARELNQPLSVRLSGYDVKTLERIKPFAEIEESQPALFRIINPDRLKQAACKLNLDETVLYAPYLS